VRRRLTLTSLAVTSMVVVSFLVPLGMLVQGLAHDRALSTAEREAEAIARFIAVVGPSRGVDQALAAIGDETSSEFGVSVVLSDGSVIGAPLRPTEDTSVTASGSSVLVELPDGDAVYVPILQSDGSLMVVRVFASDEVLTRGVTTSWLTLGLLGILLVTIAVSVFDRLALTIVKPVEELSATAASLGEGNLDARVEPAGPKEIHDVGAEFNRLAERVNQLLQQERETAADLSHQLRTPLTALRLDVEAFLPAPERTRLLDDVDELSRQLDFVIREARREVRRQPGSNSDLALLARSRLDFWRPLAEEQGRRIVESIAVETAPVALPAEDLEAMVDALIGNVLAHTPDGVEIAIRLDRDGGDAALTIEDAGPGFLDGSVVLRGMSGGSGTGLGLDIARRTAESADGSMTIGTSQALGGASVLIRLPVMS